MHYIVVAQSADQLDQIEIFQDEREADGMFAGLCSEYDLEEIPVSPVSYNKDGTNTGLMRWATDGIYYSVFMYSRKIIV